MTKRTLLIGGATIAGLWVFFASQMRTVGHIGAPAVIGGLVAVAVVIVAAVVMKR